MLFNKPWQKQKLNHYHRLVAKAGKLEPELQSLTDDELTDRIDELHTRAHAHSDITPLLPEALAVGREVSVRKMGMRHYDVQLVGTLALYEGCIAEMHTGEGKTLMAPLAAFLYNLDNVGSSVHIVTSNEYLAARDAQWMAPFLQGLGMSVGMVVPGQNQTQRAQAYQHDVVYATSKEIVFDSLREPQRKKRVCDADAILRPEHGKKLNVPFDFAIIDEVDSVLIDQARSPLSIGGESGVSPQLELYKRAEHVAGQMVRGKHFRLMHDDRSVEMKDEGKSASRARAGNALRLLPSGHRWERYVTCALAARYIYKKDQHYVVRDNRIVLIDENTGRMMPGRQLPDGIHQAIEIHNGIIPTGEIRGTAKTTYQAFFRKYKKLAGMTGTAMINASEFMSVYSLRVVQIPPNKTRQRVLHPDKVYRHLDAKHSALIEDIIRVHNEGRPILVGTASVRESEYIGSLLDGLEIPHEILNAKNHTREAEIIALAGHKDRITIITNMAGRGVDIKLGEGVAELGGMFLFSTDRQHFERLDWQLIGRVGRQGDPGECQYYISLKDDLLRYADQKKIARLRMKTRDDRNAPIASPEAAKLFSGVQSKLDKSMSKQRKKLFKYEKHREKMREQGLWEDWMDIQ